MPRGSDDKRGGKRPPWNDRVVHCVVNHLIPTVKPYAGHTTDKLVLIFTARHAHPAGCGITVTRDTLADWLGCQDRTVSVALARLRANGLMVIDGREAHGGYRHRIMLCQRCRADTAAALCQRCPAPPTAAAPSRPSAVSSRHPNNKELQGEPSGTPVSTRSRPATHSPNGDGRAGTDAGSRTPSGARQQAAEPVFQPSLARKEATAGAVIPFPARSSDAGARVGAACTGSRHPPGAPTGETFSHPMESAGCHR